MWEVARDEERTSRVLTPQQIEQLAWVRPGSSYELDVEINSKTCNLRCVYCDFSTERVGFEDYPQYLMDSSSQADVLRLIHKHPPRTIRLGGLGEPTIHPEWVKLSEPFLDLGIHTSMYTNFAKVFSPDEANTLSRISNIIVSIDTADRELLAKIRRKVDLRTILYNIAQVRTCALTANRPMPQFEFSIVISTSVIGGFDQLVRLAAVTGISQLRLVNLHEYIGAPLDDTRSILTLSLADQKTAFEQLRKGIELAYNLRMQVMIAPDLLEEGFRVFEGKAVPEPRAAGCLMPWDHVLYHGNGAASFCCSGIGRVDQALGTDSMNDLRNSPQAVSMRKAMLEGKVSHYCAACPSRLAMDQKTFVNVIANRFHRSPGMS